MANSIDFTTLAIGALIGVGCKNELKAAAKIAASAAASLATAAAVAAEQVAREAEASPEERAAAERLKRIDQNLQGQTGQNGN